MCQTSVKQICPRPHHEGVWESADTAPRIPNLGDKDECATSRAGRFTPGKESRQPLNRGPFWSQGRSGRFGEEKNLVSIQGIEEGLLGCAAPSVATEHPICYTNTHVYYSRGEMLQMGVSEFAAYQCHKGGNREQTHTCLLSQFLPSPSVCFPQGHRAISILFFRFPGWQMNSNTFKFQITSVLPRIYYNLPQFTTTYHVLLTY